MTRRWGLRPATMRDAATDHRAATPLELLFDLCFVVAVALLAAELHHGLTDGPALEAAATYALLFVPVWWAWMSYTWFATAFSHDDPLTRLLTLLQMGGVLAVAAAVPAAAGGDLVPFAVAYAVMRLPLVGQWLRAAYDDPRHRTFALVYASGSVLAQALWVGGALVGGPAGWAVFAVALAVELGTPPLAVGSTRDRVFHPGHIAERYGLFTIIVLGETILAVTVGLRDAVDGGDVWSADVAVVAAALVTAFGLWWVYFDALGRDALTRNRRAAFGWGYGHYVLFASLAAVGAGVQAQLHWLHEAGHEAGSVDRLSTALPTALALGAVGWLQQAANRRTREAARPLGAAGLVLLVGLVPGVPVAVTDLAVAAVVVATVLAHLAAEAPATARAVPAGPAH